tara:strand:+ start:136 stop:339 length:204 start_codon:yes stop_codon:yes gene_type:complete
MTRYRNRKSCKKPKSIKSNRRKTSSRKTSSRKTSKGGAIEYVYKYDVNGKRVKVRVKSKTPKSKTPK